MSSSFHPGRAATALVTAFLLMTFGLPLLREARLEGRAAAVCDELAGLGEAAPAPPPWQDRWEASIERIGRYLDAAPERPGLGYDGIPPADREALVAWAEGLREAAPELEEIVAELRRYPPAEIPYLARFTKLLGTREWQNTILLEAELAAEAGDVEGTLRSVDDALLLARAVDSGDAIGGMIRQALEGSALCLARSLVERGRLDPETVRGRLAPHLDDWAASEAEMAARIRREISNWIGLLDELEDGPERLETLAVWVEFAERADEALSLTRMSAADALAYGRRIPLEEQNPWYPTIIAGAHRQHALRNVALTTLALLGHRERGGAWPASLAQVEELPVELTLDPGTGAELPWRVEHEDTGECLVVGPPRAPHVLAWTVASPR